MEDDQLDLVLLPESVYPLYSVRSSLRSQPFIDRQYVVLRLNSTLMPDTRTAVRRALQGYEQVAGRIAEPGEACMLPLSRSNANIALDRVEEIVRQALVAGEVPSSIGATGSELILYAPNQALTRLIAAQIAAELTRCGLPTSYQFADIVSSERAVLDSILPERVEPVTEETADLTLLIMDLPLTPDPCVSLSTLIESEGLSSTEVERLAEWSSVWYDPDMVHMGKRLDSAERIAYAEQAAAAVLDIPLIGIGLAQGGVVSGHRVQGSLIASYENPYAGIEQLWVLP